MSDEAVHALARDAGVAVDWIDAAGRPQRVSIGSLRRILEALGLACGSDAQCHESRERLHADRRDRPLLTTTVGAPTPLDLPRRPATAELLLEDGSRRALRLADGIVPAIDRAGYHRLHVGDREIGLAVAPSRCITIADIAGGRRLWGVAVQLHGLRRADDGGIGDTRALAALIDAIAAEGADAVALSPTHSLFPSDPSRCSPYAPSSRLFLNPLLADPGVALPAAPDALIDWPVSGRARYEALRRAFEAFARVGDADHDRFVRDGGDLLQRHARFEASAAGVPPAFALYLQWVADRAFAAAQKAARDAGMRIGLISDLAVGVDPGGSQATTQPEDFLRGVTLGAPPDAFNARGQSWGLTSFSPSGLVARGFAPFIDMVRAALRHAGGVRIDHAMGLMRLWLVPDGAPPVEGAYLAYPFDDLLRLLALESHRHRAVVIGEDLGTVPPEFRARCRGAGIGGLDVLWFTRDGQGFLPPHDWRPDSVAMTSTHDLPTVAGWWRGADLDERDRLGLTGGAERPERTVDRARLWRAFVGAGVAEGEAPPPDRHGHAVDAACAFVAQAVDPLALLPLEDLLGLVEQPNLPGTIDEHPNWRRRLAAPAEDLLRAPEVRTRLRLIRERRE
ncbi:MAG: 4-alpha-glucanotransferase [Enhydrobacter sp.]|nr:MAG: 4-alpha-glucanotransferase [Enhydrobacter sp.]